MQPDLYQLDMTHLNKAQRLAFAICLYLLGICVFSVYIYYDVRSSLTDTLDSKLKVAAVATQNILGNSFHNNLVDHSISPEEDLSIARELTQFVSELEIVYVYSMVRRQDEILFVTSSGTPEEVAADEFDEVFYTSYPEANEAIARAFDTRQIQFAEYKDRWGEFRSIFIPYQTPNNRIYVIGADVSLARVKQASLISAVKAFLTYIFLGVIALPLIASYIRSVKRELQLETQKLFQDQLTQLPNRNQLLHDIDEAQYPNVAIINIDRFREITNTYGTITGDYVLIQFTQRLLNFDFPGLSNYTVYRLHSDEFAILANQDIDNALFDEGMRNFLSFLANGVYYSERRERVHLSATVGAAYCHKDSLTQADMALRAAKDSNRPYVVFQQEMRLPEIYENNQRQIQVIKDALREDRIVPFYQAIMNTRTHEIEKFECLARLIDHNGDVLQFPDEFLPIAYRTRLYNDITKTIFDKAIEDAKRTTCRITVNLSITDLNNSSTMSYIINTLNRQQIGHLVDFELLENESIENSQRIVDTVYQLKALGCRIGVDDLGKDYSNFDRIVTLPIDFVKIDGSLMRNISHNRASMELVKNIVNFARNMNLLTVAEFCSSEEIYRTAVDLGVDYVQGHYIGEPSPTFQYETTLTERNEELRYVSDVAAETD